MNLSQRIESTVTPQPTFAEMLEKLWVEKHTGPVIVHFLHGRPKEVIPMGSRIILDKGHAQAHP